MTVRLVQRPEWGSQESPVSWGEPHLLAVQLSFEHHELMAQGGNLHLLRPIIHVKQPRHRQRLAHAKIGKSKQHGNASSATHHQPSNLLTSADWKKVTSWTLEPALTRADDIFGTRSAGLR